MLLLQHCFTVLACPFPAIPRTHAPHSIIPLSFPSGHVGLQFLRLLYRTVKSYKKLLVSLYTSKYANDVYPTHFPQFTGLISASAGRDTEAVHLGHRFSYGKALVGPSPTASAPGTNLL